MRTVWRLCSARFADSAMSGEGARLYGGRWNRRGTSMVYCASTLSLGMLEVLVHASVLPRDYVAIQVDIPDGVAVETLAVGSLPANWVATPAPALLATIGSRWVAQGSTCALEVPSAVVAIETNVVLNPSHPDMNRLRVHPAAPLAFDARLG